MRMSIAISLLLCRMHSECQIRTLISLEDIIDYAPLFTEDETVSIVHIIDT